jgi:hypothetical protein
MIWDSLRLINCEALYEKRELFHAKLYKYNLFKNLTYSL